jgi:7-cyano-7-deazaguanine reductase
MIEYTARHATSGLDINLPKIECWPNQFKDYTITITIPEFTSICPKTKLPDSGTIIIKYCPGSLCIELKSLKMYVVAYRNVGIFYENAVNRILQDVVKACSPKWAEVRGEFAPRGGIKSIVEVTYLRSRGKRRDSLPGG